MLSEWNERANEKNVIMRNTLAICVHSSSARPLVRSSNSDHKSFKTKAVRTIQTSQSTSTRRLEEIVTVQMISLNL